MDGSTTSDLDADEPTLDIDPVPTGSLPKIADYWPDAPHRMQPDADYYPDSVEDSRPVTPAYPPATQVIGPPPPRRRRRGLRLLLAMLAMLVFFGGTGLVLARMVLGTGAPGTAASTAPQTAVAAPAPSPPVSVEPAPTDPPATTAPPASAAAVLPFTSGTFELASDVTELNVSIADLGTDPIQATTPAGSGIKLRTTVGDGAVKLFADRTGGTGNGRLDVRLNRKVTWSVLMTGGVRDGTFGLVGGSIRRIDLNGGAARLTMALGTPDETLPIRMTGGVNTWRITTATEVPLSVLLRKGAGEVSLNGHKTRKIKRNTNVRDGSGAGGLGIDAVGGLGTLTVTPASGDDG